MEENQFDTIQRQGFEALLTVAGEWREIVTLFKPGANLAPIAPQPDSGRIYSGSAIPPVIPVLPGEREFHSQGEGNLEYGCLKGDADGWSGWDLLRG
jgi:hypothetical protein